MSSRVYSQKHLAALAQLTANPPSGTRLLTSVDQARRFLDETALLPAGILPKLSGAAKQ